MAAPSITPVIQRRESPIRIAVTAITDADAAGLRELFTSNSAGESVDWLVEPLPLDIDALVLAIPSNGIAVDGDPLLREFSEKVKPWLAMRGRHLRPCALPFLIVDGRRPEAQTQLDELSRRLRDQFDSLLSSAPGGFGGILLKTAILPGTASATEASHALVHDVIAAAREYRNRLERQALYVRRALLFTLLALAVLTVPVVIALLGRVNSPKSTDTVSQSPDAATTDPRELLSRIQKLLKFDGVELTEASPATWLTWHQHTETALADSEGLIGDGRADNLRAPAELQAAGTRLRDVRQLLLLLAVPFQLANQEPHLYFSIQRAKSATLADLQAEAKTRWTELQQQRDVHLGALPADAPYQLIQMIRVAAHASHENWLAPVRREIHRQVLAAGNDNETLTAWRNLIQNGALKRMSDELVEWRLIANTLRRLANGTESADPFIQLERFFLRDEFQLSLDRVELQWLDSVEVAGVRVTGLKPADRLLTIRHRKSDGADANFVFDLKSEYVDPLTGLRRLVFEEKSNRGGNDRLLSRPGDQLSAHLRVQDGEGKAWSLTWSATEARSPLYTFQALTLAPRLHAADQPDPTRGTILFGVRLLFSEPHALELPELFPR